MRSNKIASIVLFIPQLFVGFFNYAKSKLNEPIFEGDGICPGCNLKYSLGETYCYRCGEAKLDPVVDNSIFIMFRELLTELFNYLDIKVAHTAAWLIFRPGKLARAHIVGIKNKVLKPFTILTFFVFIFFSVYEKVTLFHADYEELSTAYNGRSFNTANVFLYNIDEKIALKKEEINKDVSYIIETMDRRSEEISKGFYLVIWIGLIIALCLFFRVRHYREHIFFAANIYAAYMLHWLIACFILITLLKMPIPASFPTSLSIYFVFYIIASAKYAYKINYKRAIVIGAQCWIAFFLILVSYRQLMPLISLWMIKY